MPLTPGTRVGQYQIGALLGAGGMGEVYRARDLTLHREVAVKVITAREPDEAMMLARFEREARLLASLNHPQIASIYGVVQDAGVRAIVMEIVEGPSLSERLEAGRLPVGEALGIAGEIAGAIEAAHEKGIIHRDLKPSNIKFAANGAVKVLDFGIGKALEVDTDAIAQAATMEATRAGTIVGTAAYMSPEQARGLPVDTRTDVWAFGVVLYEMLTGRRAFEGTTASDVIAAVLTTEPDWSGIPATVPPAVVRMLRHCLERDQAKRLRQIGALRYVLEDARGARAQPALAKRDNVARSVALLAAGLVAGAGLTFVIRGATAGPAAPAGRDASALMLSMSGPPGEPLYLFAGPIAISPDGRRVALVTNSAQNKPHLWLRALDQAAPELLEAADGGMYPFWSPDGRSLGFFVAGELKVIDLTSRALRSIAPWHGPAGGGAWNAEGVIVFTDNGGLVRVSAAGGKVTPLAALQPGAPPGTFTAGPQFLPDQHHVLFYAGTTTGSGALMLGALDGSEPVRLMETTSQAVYAPPGYLLYHRDGKLMAQRFNASSLAVEGEPAQLASGSWLWATGGLTAISASSSGLLMFATRPSNPTKLTWFDRNGRPTGTLGETAEWVHVALSPDDRTVAAEQMDPRLGIGTIWTIDVGRNLPARLTPDPEWSFAPVWAPDGNRLVYSASRQGPANLFVRSADGVGAEQPFFISPHLKIATDWSRDGRIVFNLSGSEGTDVVSLPFPSRPGQPSPILASPFVEGSGKISPNGRWIVYSSNESGRAEVYVRALNGPGRWPISRNGGWQPRWRHDGRELFFVGADSTLMATKITDDPVFTAGEPQALPIRVAADVTGWRYPYDVVESGQRFLVVARTAGEPPPPIMAIPQWTALLRK